MLALAATRPFTRMTVPDPQRRLATRALDEVSLADLRLGPGLQVLDPPPLLSFPKGLSQQPIPQVVSKVPFQGRDLRIINMLPDQSGQGLFGKNMWGRPHRLEPGRHRFTPVQGQDGPSGLVQDPGISRATPLAPAVSPIPTESRSCPRDHRRPDCPACPR